MRLARAAGHRSWPLPQQAAAKTLGTALGTLPGQRAPFGHAALAGGPWRRPPALGSPLSRPCGARACSLWRLPRLLLLCSARKACPRAALGPASGSCVPAYPAYALSQRYLFPPSLCSHWSVRAVLGLPLGSRGRPTKGSKVPSRADPEQGGHAVRVKGLRPKDLRPDPGYGLRANLVAVPQQCALGCVSTRPGPSGCNRTTPRRSPRSSLVRWAARRRRAARIL